MQPRSAKTYVMPMQRVNNEFILRIREIRDPVTHEVPGDFFQDIKRLAFESIAVVALNKELGLIRKNRDRPEANELFDNLQTLIDLMYNLEFQPSVWKYIWTPTYAKFKKCNDVVFETINAYVEEAVKQYEDEKRGNLDDSELSVLEKLMKIDKAVAVVMAVDMLMAGVDTTSVTLAGILLQIAKNPEKQVKLREEIRRVLPEKDSLFTVESMQNLPYLRACIKESIRMHPIGSGGMRRCGENLVLCGYQVPKGTVVITNSNLLMSEEKYFPSAREFVPERWVRGNSAEKTIVPFTYLPFGHGPRMCVGKRIVDIELEVTLARLVSNFYLEFNYPIDKAFKSHAMIRPDIPLTFKFTEVEN